MLDTVIRAAKGAIRSPVRTALVVVLLAVGLSFALTSVALAFAAGDELDKVKATTGVEASLTINPGQFREAIQAAQEEAQASGEEFDPSDLDIELQSLTGDNVDAIESLSYVRNAEGLATSPIQYSIPGQEDDERDEAEPTPTPAPDTQGDGQGDPGGGFIGGGSAPDATITGVNDAAFLDDFQDGTKTIVDGRLYDASDDGANVVVIDENTATLEELAVGDTITLTAVNVGRGPGAADTTTDDETEAPEIDAQIVGVFQDVETASQGGFGFNIQQWYAPLSLISELQDEDAASDLTSISIVVDSVDDFGQLRTDLATVVDPDAFSLTTSEDSFDQISQPIETMRNTSFVVMFVGLSVVGAIMVMLMIIVMRARLREIGILKAIGAKSRQVVTQFALETVGIAVVAVVIAIPSVFAINTFLPDLIRPSAEVAADEADGPFQVGNNPGGGPGGGFAVFGGGQGLADPVLTEDVEAALDQIDASVSADVIAIGAAVAIALGLLGTAVTLFTVLRLRPAEVLRLEA